MSEKSLNLHKKVMILLGLACLFITFVMVFFLFQGVTPRVPKMVKWSSVESPGISGDRLAAFLFPLLKGSEKVSIQGNSEFSKLFFESFFKRARKERIKTEIQRVELKNDPGGFSILIFQLKDSLLKSFCKKNQSFLHGSDLDFQKSFSSIPIRFEFSELFPYWKTRKFKDDQYKRTENSNTARFPHFSPEEAKIFFLKVCRLREKALGRFHKKRRDPSFYWITMDRPERNKAVLFFQLPLKNKGY